MKPFAKILIAFFFSIITIQIIGHDFWVCNSCHIHCKQSSSNHNNNSKIISSDVSIEEENIFDILAITGLNLTITIESYKPVFCFYSRQLYFTIWLPPDIS
jgi:hypothetical protein